MKNIGAKEKNALCVIDRNQSDKENLFEAELLLHSLLTMEDLLAVTKQQKNK
ncbi:hypothetical protein [Solibacillus sp. FSL K6-1523]|uniref:hypothetical protein n=1 Tax=Solibacillus sp. FSL K6-1523 TaxID=2921471 RepID=UPI0030F932F3